MSNRYLERVILGEERGLGSWVIRFPLWPWSMVYRIGLAAYLALYSSGLRKRHKLSVPVISVGNLTFGGTGKTPAVQSICRMLMEGGKRVAILSRGHGGSARESLVVSDGKSILCDVDQSGDEPMELATSLPGVPVIVGRDRRLSGELAVSRFAPDVIVLDDGLQYWQLHRDLDIVVLDAVRPFGSGFVMPMGDLREPVTALRRAGIVLLRVSPNIPVFRHCEPPSFPPSQGGTKGGRQVFRCERKPVGFCCFGKPFSRNKQAQIFRCEHKPAGFRKIDGGETLDLNWAKGRKILAFCGIGRPERFIDMLASLGADIVGGITFADHHVYTDQELSTIENEMTRLGAEAAVTTEKDAARLGKLTVNELHALDIELEIEDSSSFASYIRDKINRQDTAALA